MVTDDLSSFIEILVASGLLAAPLETRLATVLGDCSEAYLRVAMFDVEPAIRCLALDNPKSTRQHWLLGLKDESGLVRKKALEIIQIRKGEF